MKNINQEEYEILKGLDDKWKWIARDGFTGIVNVYEDKPRKIGLVKEWTPMGDRANKTITKGNLFQTIQWEGEGPHSIAELIEEYEEDYKGSWEHAIEFSKEMRSESEEAEVKKDIEWLKEEVTEILLTSKKDGTNYFYYRDLKEKIYNAIDRLDEPEVLSQEWIDEHAKAVTYDGIPDQTEIVYVDDLQSLLVPKQEEVDQAYKDGYEKGKQHTFYKGYLEGLSDKENELETVADVVTTFWKSFERLKEVMSMEVEELEE